MVLNKKGFGNFGTIIAMIGSILIAVGIAWLLADNWHLIPSVLKIIILLGLTFSTFFAGVQFKVKKFSKIGSTLIFLGSALFTLSVFLIAQIFSLPTTLQMNSTLILISMIGVFLASYVLSSSSSLLLGLIQVFFYSTFQFLAIMKNSEFSFAYIAILYLLLGIFIYGLKLIHEHFKNKFSKIYRIFSIMYFLLFAYILTFEDLLPNLWLKGFDIRLTGLVFLISVAVISIATFVYAVKSGIRKSRKEIIFFGIIIAVLTTIIFSSYLVLSGVGSCSAKYCYDLQNQEECNLLESAYGECVWKDNYCMEKSCYIYTGKDVCEGNFVNGRQCIWDKSSCVEDNCYLYQSETSCADASIKFNNTCKWETTIDGGYCFNNNDRKFDSGFNKNEQECQAIAEKNVCESNSSCKWGPYNNYYNKSSGRGEPLNVMLFWIFTNIIFLALIILFIFYATIEKDQTLINIGIIFFALDIVTRYIGFIVDYAGYLSLSIFFITGGVILVAGGYFIEKWRRNLISKTRGGRR